VYEYWTAREALGITEAGVGFFPYWAEERVAEAAGPDVYISAYENRGRWLLCAANLGLQDWTGEVKVNRRVFGRPEIGVVTDAADQATLPADGARFSLSIPARDYRLLFVE
jgi:hypothetical protein